MKLGAPVFISAALGLTVTLAYCLAVGYLSALWTTLVTDQVNISGLSVWTIKPQSGSPVFAMWHWYSAAFLSLIVNAAWARRRLATSQRESDIALPMCCHLCWLVTAMFLHVGGGLASLVTVAYSLT